MLSRASTALFRRGTITSPVLSSVRGIGNDLDKLDDARPLPKLVKDQHQLTARASDFLTFDPARIPQEEEEEKQKFTDYIEVFGEHRFGL